MNLKAKFIGIFRHSSLIFLSLIAYPLAGQQTGSSPVINIVSPLSADSLNTSGRILLRAEIISNTPLQTFSVVQNGIVFVSETSMKLEQKEKNNYILESLVPLNGGFNTVYIEAKNAAGITISEKRTINCSLVPFITWLVPSSSTSSEESGILNIKAEIRTASPLQKLTVNLGGNVSADEKSAVSKTNDDTYIFEKTIQLNPGRNNIYITAGNARGENKSDSRVINFGTSPVITIVSPLSTDSVNTSGRILIKAEIVSHSPLQTFSIVHNDKPFVNESDLKPIQKDKFTYIIESFLPLNGGLNTVYIAVKNSLGTSYSEKRVIDSRLTPFITWLEPVTAASNAETGMMNIKAEIRTSVPLQKLTVNINGVASSDERSSLSRVNDDTYIFEKAIQLNSGRNNINISASNTRGEYKSVNRVINFGTAPVITMASPSPADSLNNSGRILVRAEINSLTPLLTFKILLNESVYINETEMKPVQKDKNTYVIESLVPLKEGINAIYVEAKNALGTRSSEKRIVENLSAPIVTWILPVSAISSTESGKVSIKAEIKTFFELKNVSLTLNGTVLPAEQGELTRMNDDTYIFERTVQDVLSTKNTVIVTASNLRGKAISSPRIINYLSGLKPVITIAATDSLNNSGIISLSAEIVSRTRLQAVRLVHNGTIIVNESTKNPEQKDSITYIIKSLLPLREGLNVFFVEAKNTIGTTSSERRNIVCKPEPIIRWVSPASANSTAGSGTLNIKAEIITNFDILNTGINLNGTALANQTDGITRVNNDTYVFEKTVTLKEGENSITLSAGSARGTGYSVRRNINYVPGVVSEIKWVTPSETNSDTRKAEFPVTATIITKSDIKNVRLILNGIEMVSGDRSKTTKKNSQEYSYENILTLKPGSNTVELSATTSDGAFSSEKRTITYTTPVLPALAWQNPVPAQSEVNQASLDFRMNIKSADELNNIAVYLNGKALDNISLLNSVKKENEYFVLGNTIVLKPGDNTLYVSAVNPAGTATSESRNIKYTVPSMPVIAWGNPGSAVSTQSAQTITVIANITSTTDLKDLKIYHNNNPLPGNPVVTTIDKQQGVYHVEETVNLNQGENRIYIVAGNMAGNTTSETRSISYVTPAAPVITWIAPSKPSTSIDLTTPEIRAIVKSTEKLQSLMVYVNGIGSEEINQVNPTGVVGEYMIRKTVNLQPGDNTIFLSVTNSVGSIRSEDRVLTNPPAKKPVITWAVPSDLKTVVNSDMIIVEACINSSSDLKLVQIFVNSVQWTSETMFQTLQPGDCSFRLTKSVLLKEGENTVIINATNLAGSEMSERRTILYQKGIAERRLALVMGNSEYANTLALKNPVNDANLMEGTLKTLGFEVIKSLNADRANMEKAIRQFSEKLPDYNVALFYYAGHGIQVNGENYLIPTDAKLDKEADCQWEAVQVNTIVRQFEQVPENINIIILDACRDNPFKSWSRGAPQGFKMLNTVSGTFVAFATAEGATAADGTDFNGIYTQELVRQMVIPQPIFNVFTQTSNQVKKKTGNKQQPTISSSLSGDFWFKR